jgi:hypothetical protein
MATTYSDIQRILDDAISNEDIGAHGAFWRDMPRDTFVTHKVFGCQIIHSDRNGTFIGPQSPLVLILRGPIECPPTRQRPQMPDGFPPVPDDQIQNISDWIDAQCPE